MRINWFTHIPGVKTDLSFPFHFSVGKLQLLDFEYWQKMDCTFPTQKKSYEKSQPVFFSSSIEEFDDLEAATAQIQNINNHLYWAFLLGSGGALLPNPQMSCTYIEFEHGIFDGYKKLIGSFEREWIVFGGSWKFNFSEEVLHNISVAFDLLLSSKGFKENHSIMQGLRTLQFTSNPEFCLKKDRLSYFNGFVYCMAGLESILVPLFVRKKYGLTITEAFGMAASVVQSQNFSQSKQSTRYFSEVYRVRSKMIHGEASSVNYTENVEQAFHVIRNLYCNTIGVLIKLIHNGYKIEDFPNLLLKAWEEESIYDEFKNLLKYNS
ncbi:hypothetical protein MM236_01555 [Belliella sp. DSM 107340]|uniref:Apea-like HEPN domain-containing protein n=1 Tax=Belliella calami TaxID=2923436 RepID=A0ABS9UJ44_9BACT|nr:hypothetical protein [Belliella calami]MCH7396647.1 hypothetical protein [Belliella calami]